MEATAALPELADLIADDELGELDRAVDERGRQIGGEGELREGAECLLLEAFIRRRRRGGVKRRRSRRRRTRPRRRRGDGGRQTE